ncbi:MAG: thiol:disulfide interchange protein DsbA/DsbL [Sulfuriferula sp.]
MLRKFISASLLACAFFIPLTSQAAIVAGKDYQVLSTPMSTDSGKKIEVAEFFWYSCSHCFHLEPGLNKWVKTMPKDAQIRRIPAVLRDTWMPLAKAYYAMEAMGVVNKYHDTLFNAIHMDNMVIEKDSDLFDWAAKAGMNQQAFMNAYQSFSVQSKVLRANQLIRDAQITGVPSFVVDGKYVTTVSMTGSEAALFSTLNELIVKARKEHTQPVKHK